jgi:hypothetical protein
MSTGTNNWSGRRQPRWVLGLVALVAIARSFGGVDSQPVFAQSVPAGQEQVNSGASADDSAFLFSGRAPADVEQLKVWSSGPAS